LRAQVGFFTGMLFENKKWVFSNSGNQATIEKEGNMPQGWFFYPEVFNRSRGKRK